MAVAFYPMSTVSILLGDGDGLFHKGVDFVTGNGPYSLAMGDLDGDGRQDLAVGGFTTRAVSIYLGRGDGTFAWSADYACGGRCELMSIGDSSNDGKLDVVVVNVDPQVVSGFAGRGDGTLGRRSDYPAPGYASSVAIGDLNGDGRPDLVLDGGPVTVRLGQSDGTFGPSYDCANRGNGVAIADLNRDGRPDIATLDNQRVGVFAGNGDGTFGGEAFYPAPGDLASLAIADVNRDGRPDIVASSLGSWTDAPGAISVLCGDSTGGFAPAVQYPTASSPRCATVADLNGDGWPEIVCANTRDNAVSVMVNNGDGTFGGS